MCSFSPRILPGTMLWLLFGWEDCCWFVAAVAGCRVLSFEFECKSWFKMREKPFKFKTNQKSQALCLFVRQLCCGCVVQVKWSALS